MSGPEPRRIVRHRVSRHRSTGVIRPYPMAVAVLVTLASTPMLAAVLVGSASLVSTSHPRSPAVADAPEAPVVVPGRRDAGTPPPVGIPPTQTPTPAPAATPASTGGNGEPVPAAGDAVTVGPQSKLRAESTRAGGSGSGTSSRWRRSSSKPSGPLPGPSPSTPPGTPAPSAQPNPAPSAPPSPSPTPEGVVAGLVGVTGGLLGVSGLLGGH